MFDVLFERPHAIMRQLSSPLLQERRNYLSFCSKQGMARRTLREVAIYLLVVIKYLNLSEVSQERFTSDQINEAAGFWAEREPKPPHMQVRDLSRRRFKTHATRWLTFLDRLQSPVKVACEYDPQIADFAAFMDHERGFSPLTIEARCHTIRLFLGELYTSGHRLNAVTVSDIDAALARRVNEQKYARVTVRTLASSLRSFFRYAEVRGWCTKGLASSIMAPRVFSQESLPFSPTWDQIQKLLEGISGDRPAEIRDRAIILLLAVYGLRAGEITRIRLEDIDWQSETIIFRRSKRLGTHPYPLCRTVGDAIIRYLKEVRPHSALREIFLILRAPIRPLTSGTLWPIVARRLRPIAVGIKHHGPHSLRHACATHLINEGLSLKEIGDHLGHHNPETTRIYTKVDLTHLREVAKFDLGGLL